MTTKHAKPYRRSRSGKLCELVALYMECDKHTAIKEAAHNAGLSMAALVDDIIGDHLALGGPLMTQLAHIAERDGLDRRGLLVKIVSQYVTFRNKTVKD